MGHICSLPGLRLRWAALGIGLVACAGMSLADMVVQGLAGRLHDRYYGGGDKAFIGQALDFSGAGKNNQHGEGRWATLVTSTYFLTAAHAPFGVSPTIRFYEDDTTSNPHSYTGSVVGSIADILVGRLDSPADSSLARYPILFLPTLDEYIGLELWNAGRSGTSYNWDDSFRVGRNILGTSVVPNTTTPYPFATSLGTLSMLYDYDTPGVGDDETLLASGDSGGPSFVSVGGQLALVGLHQGIYAPPDYDGSGSVDSFVPNYISEIQAIITGDGSAETLTVLIPAIPEPGTTSLVLAALSIVLIGRPPPAPPLS